MKAPRLAIVLSIPEHSLLKKLEPKLRGEFIWITQDYEPQSNRIGEDTQAVRAYVCTGLLAGKQRVFANIKTEPVDLAACLHDEVLCACECIPFPHKENFPGCRSQYEPPFCGKCGKHCDIRYERELESSGDRYYYTDLSECCDVEQLFQDASLTKPYKLGDNHGRS